MQKHYPKILKSYLSDIRAMFLRIRISVPKFGLSNIDSAISR